MNNHEEDEDVTMQSSMDPSTDQEDHKEEPSSPLVASVEHPVVQAPIQLNAAGSKELRVQLQEEDQNDVESEEEAVAEAVVADEDDDDGDAVMASVVVEEEEEDEDASLAQSNTTTDDAPPANKPMATKPKKTPRKSTRTTQDRLAAATEARNLIVDTVPRLPVLVSDSHVVRSFGRIKVDKDENKFSSANALYPVGFSCDRYEFSPVHGRVLKMRCTIFDGKKLKEKQRQCGRSPSDIPDGPIFRVMWGQGVDEDVDIVDYPYDVYSASAPLSDDTKVEAVAMTSKEMSDDLEPEEGMRVRVRFERDVWFSGTIVSVGDDEYDEKKKQTMYDIRIHYDDGSIEDTRFPDPDISIYLPGTSCQYCRCGMVLMLCHDLSLTHLFSSCR